MPVVWLGRVQLQPVLTVAQGTEEGCLGSQVAQGGTQAAAKGTRVVVAGTRVAQEGKAVDAAVGILNKHIFSSWCHWLIHKNKHSLTGEKGLQLLCDFKSRKFKFIFNLSKENTYDKKLNLDF